MNPNIQRAMIDTAKDFIAFTQQSNNGLKKMNVPRTLLKLTRKLKGKGEKEAIETLQQFKQVLEASKDIDVSSLTQYVQDASGQTARRTWLLQQQKERELTNEEWMELISSDMLMASMQMNSTGAAEILSPRLFSLAKDTHNRDAMRVLSPDVLSLHNDSLIGVPRLLNLAGADNQDDWMELITEVSGAADTMGEVLEALKKEEIEAQDRIKIAKAQLRYMDTIDRTIDSLSDEGKEKFARDGFTMLDEKQAEILEELSPDLKESMFDLKEFSKLPKWKKKMVLEAKIYDVAGEGHRNSPEMQTWQKRAFVPTILTPLVLVSIVLAPLVLSPIILSPLVLDSVVLSPLVLSPLILSPAVLFPVILSPLVLSPLILTPRALSPLVLSPDVLGPVILSPHVLSPFILSPLVLTPHVLSPAAVWALVLSPGVGNPLVLSPPVVFASVLSPQALFCVC